MCSIIELLIEIYLLVTKKLIIDVLVYAIYQLCILLNTKHYIVVNNHNFD